MGLSYEDGRAALDRLRKEITDDMLIKGGTSEADTRAKVIDRVLREVIGWPDAAIRREPHTETGFIDYVLRSPHPLLVIEAKRIGDAFVLPANKKNSSYVLRGISDEKTGLGAAIRQARRYADDEGIEYACASNGAQWVVFQAITRNHSWLDGKAFVFRSLDDIYQRFVEFWNLLSFDAIANSALANTFGSSLRAHTEFSRPLQHIGYADAPLERNPLAPQLQSLITAAFSDLAGWRDPNLLRTCYIWEGDTRDFQRSVDDTTASSMPAFARRAGFRQLILQAESSGEIDDAFRRAVEVGSYGTTILLLGKVGSGKTTLLQRLISVTAPADARASSAIVYVPFTNAPPDPAGVESFIRKQVLAELRDRHPDIEWMSASFLRGVYKADLDTLRVGILDGLPEATIREREAQFLERAVQSPEHADMVLRFLRSAGIPVVIVIDNMDHHSSEQQEQAFLHAHAVSRSFDAIVLVALREETFFRGMQARSFNAYSNIRFQVTPPDVRKMIIRRLDFVLKACNGGPQELQRLTRSYVEFDVRSIKLFLREVQRCLRSGEDGNPAIAQFLDNLAQGNMREALDMFGQYVVSGATKVKWILDIVDRQGAYRIAEHEFIKAVMLGDFKFYKDSRSKISNLFEVSAARSASNLTSLRLLRYLIKRQGAAHHEGPGYVSIDACMSGFAEVFGEADDVAFHAERLLRRRLIEVDTRHPESLVGAQMIRATRAGIYSTNILCRRFQYLDTVALDTPVCVPSVRSWLTGQVDPDRIEDRIQRTEVLLAYLDSEEERSLQGTPGSIAADLFGTGLVTEIREHYDQDLRTRVLRRTGVSYERVTAARQRAKAIVLDRGGGAV